MSCGEVARGEGSPLVPLLRRRSPAGTLTAWSKGPHPCDRACGRQECPPGRSRRHEGDGEPRLAYIWRASETGERPGVTRTGTSGNDTLVGSPGDDVIRCGAGNDVAYGGGGNDLIECGSGNDSVFGGPGNDRLFDESGNDRIEGGAGDDLLVGASGNDRLFGGPGADRTVPGTGRDSTSP